MGWLNSFRRPGKGPDLDIDRVLFPGGPPTARSERDALLECYKIMVASSESLVSRRQGVNSFFLATHGAIVTAVGLLIASGQDGWIESVVVVLLAVFGIALTFSWRGLISSLGQLNAEKFFIIEQIEQFLPVAIYAAEWQGLTRRGPKRYKTSTSREMGVTGGFLLLYAVLIALSFLQVIAGECGGFFELFHAIGSLDRCGGGGL